MFFTEQCHLNLTISNEKCESKKKLKCCKPSLTLLEVTTTNYDFGSQIQSQHADSNLQVLRLCGEGQRGERTRCTLQITAF